MIQPNNELNKLISELKESNKELWVNQSDSKHMTTLPKNQESEKTLNRNLGHKEFYQIYEEKSKTKVKNIKCKRYIW